MKSRIGFVIPQFGGLPNYIHYFILSASYSSNSIDFIFISDRQVKFNPKITNVFFIKMTLNKFNNLCREKLKVDFRIKNPYKLCDLKPMYGLIFEDYLKDYEYWGHCDFDIIFGDIQSLLKRQQFSSFDIFCVQETYASGPFQIFRNDDKINRFFMQSSSWQEVLSLPNYVGFDEAGDVIKELWKGKNIWECSGKILSMTHLLKDDVLLQKLKIRVSMKKLITENFIEKTTVNFDQGRLFLQPTNEELFIYHFIILKNRTIFNDLLINKNITTFQFSKRGFYTGNKMEFIVGLVNSVLKRYWLRLVKKLR